MKCSLPVFLATLITSNRVGAFQPHDNIILGVGKLPAVAAFMYVAFGDESKSSKKDQAVSSLATTEVLQAAEEDTPEKILENYDKDKNGKLTLVEYTAGWDEKDKHQPHEISDVFANADHDKDGMLNFEELKGFMEELDHENKEEDKKEEAENILENYDENADGKLTLVEFHFLLGLTRKNNRAKVLDLFTTADLDKNGMLDLEELEVALERLDHEEEEEQENQKAENILGDYDQNKDGKLTLAEYTADWDEKDKHQPREISDIFANADHDKDGMLNLEELKIVMGELDHEDAEQEREMELDKLITTKLANSTSKI